MESTMTLNGYLGHDIDLRHTRMGHAVVTFRVGTTPRIKTAQGWGDGTTTWVTVVCYRYLAENVANSLRKGDLVIVHGKVRTQAWDDAEGVHRERMVIEASMVGPDLSRGVAALARTASRGAGPISPEAEVVPEVGPGLGPEPGPELGGIAEGPEGDFADEVFPALAA